MGWWGFFFLNRGTRGQRTGSSRENALIYKRSRRTLKANAQRPAEGDQEAAAQPEAAQGDQEAAAS